MGRPYWRFHLAYKEQAVCSPECAQGAMEVKEAVRVLGIEVKR
jgi:hypothetical protein